MTRWMLCIFLISLIACSPAIPSGKKAKEALPPLTVPMTSKPKNLILMIGDGMGITQITAGLYANKNRLNMERFPIVGLHKPYSSDQLITDSAAGATSFACGIKTYNGAIGVDPTGNPVKTILEEAEENGLATGMVVTSTIVHATPASFIAHQKSRAFYEQIAEDFLKTEIDFFIGGGKKYFDRRDSDERNLSKELEENGYYVSDYYQEDLGRIDIDRNKNFAYFTADDGPLTVANGRDYLYAASKIGMNFLKVHEPKGFFMMIEGSQIDWGGHANNEDYVITELLDFDKTIGAVLEFAERDGETLVVVTADHETGGMSIIKGSKMNKLKIEFADGYHTADLIPVFAYGPGAELFSGVYENTEIYFRMKKALGL